MGTDICLEWEGMTEEEKRLRLTGFSINAGNVGYLRASIGMVTENSFLRCLFPPEFWKSREPIRYKFTEEGYKQVITAGAAYLIAKITGKEIISLETNTNKLAKALNVDNIKVPNIDFREAVIWLNSVFNFYELGLDKEKENKEPKVDISW